MSEHAGPIDPIAEVAPTEIANPVPIWPINSQASLKLEGPHEREQMALGIVPARVALTNPVSAVSEGMRFCAAYLMNQAASRVSWGLQGTPNYTAASFQPQAYLNWPEPSTAQTLDKMVIELAKFGEKVKSNERKIDEFQRAHDENKAILEKRENVLKREHPEKTAREEEEEVVELKKAREEEVVELKKAKEENEQLKKRIEDAVLCVVCAHEFTLDGDRVPRVLSCGHTFCEHCISTIAVKDRKKKMCFKCPNDEKKTSFNRPSDLPKNFVILSNFCD
ncbi:unnamed protein product [Caenorhabditis sp. 36 PRJEB53466]|nr:unnamed protein product [Caenorhabditis sp. 36 PRJEB53466]